jgi:hypothetical protein
MLISNEPTFFFKINLRIAQRDPVPEVRESHSKIKGVSRDLVNLAVFVPRFDISTPLIKLNCKIYLMSVKNNVLYIMLQYKNETFFVISAKR